MSTKVKRALNTLEVAEFQADEDDNQGLLQAQRDLEFNELNKDTITELMAALEGEELTTLISRIDIFDCEVHKLTVKI
jgi:hypothetical protein